MLLYFSVLQGGDLTDTVKKLLLLTVGIFSMLFFLVCLYFSHIGVSWLWLWPLLSLFCLVRYLMIRFSVPVPRWLRVIYYTALICFLALFVFVEAQILSAMRLVPEPGLDYVITLGAAVRDGQPTSPLLLRIERTAQYLTENPDTLVIASGGQGPTESMSEAECIRRLLTEEYGIDESRILLEDKSTDTQQNIEYSFRMIPEGASVGVITSNFHVYRAMRTAELAGHPVRGIPARALLPLGLHYTVREFFAVVQLEAENAIKLVKAAAVPAAA